VGHETAQLILHRLYLLVEGRLGWKLVVFAGSASELWREQPRRGPDASLRPDRL